VAFIVGALFAALFAAKPGGYGWGGAVLMAVAAVIVPTLQFRVYWKKARFWATVALLAIVQVPLIVAAHQLVDRLRAAFLLVFGVVDGLCVIAVIFYASGFYD
jgi:hypothetical protein